MTSPMAPTFTRWLEIFLLYSCCCCCCCYYYRRLLLLLLARSIEPAVDRDEAAALIVFPLLFFCDVSEKQTIASSLKQTRAVRRFDVTTTIVTISLAFLYRKIYRAAALFPTESRTLFVRDRLQRAYREKTNSGKEEDREERVRFKWEIQLETILCKANTREKCSEDERVHARF